MLRSQRIKAYVLCFSRVTTLHDFGPHCFAVHDLKRFFELVWKALEKAHGGKLREGCGNLRYDRHSIGFKHLHPVFVGTKKYGSEHEIRMAWWPEEPIAMGDLKPLVLEVPGLCETFKRL